MVHSIFTEDQFKKNDFIIIFLFFTSIILFLSLTGYTFLGVQDEVQLQSTLAAGDPRNYMMSYPLSILVSFLYTKLPAIPWYSILMLLYISLISLLMAIYIARSNNDKFLKYILLSLFTLILILILFDVTVTLISVMLIVFAVPLIRNHQIYFWILLFLASLLRVEMILNISPLILLVYLTLVRKTSFNAKSTLLMLFLLAAMSLNYISSSFDKEYKEWLTFQKARIYFNDKKGTNKKNILTNDEFQLAHSWWICDPDIYPVDKIMKAAGSNVDVIRDVVLTKYGIKRALNKVYQNKILLVLILLTLYILYLEKNNLRRGYYILFTIGFFSLILVKDQQRTTLPVVMLWSMILVLTLLKNHKDTVLKIFLFFVIVHTVMETPWEKVTNYKQNEQLVSEFKNLVKRNGNMKLEPPSGFTASWKLTQTVLEQNHLLYEKDDVDFNHHLVLAQWFTMHPIFFEQHDITFKNTKRKFNTYYEYLLDVNTGIIGSKDRITINPFLAENLLRMYDEKFAVELACHHKIKIVDESEHFIVKQIVKECI